ncbi:MAG: DUF512 domain-containing protein [Clostridiales bacterium]|nr:DUF512 domain-containing protein [Clostridiales bacterium]
MLTIEKVKKNSIGEELGLEKGDVILAFDGHSAVDILDYLFYDEREFFTLTVRQKNGDESTCEIEKDEDETLGLTFKDDNLSIRTCHNKCAFCFIDQMPKGLRDTLYVKDDDYRQSFLCGNFVTLTNLTDEDEERILRLNLSPLYISVHTMNGELRKKLTGNRFADKIAKQIELFSAHGIVMHTQVVLARGYNDGKELEYTARELFKHYPYVQTMAVVPVGMTKFREGLTKIEDIDSLYAKEVLDQIRKLNEEFKTDFIQPADEFYFRAGLEVEKPTFYGNFPQIENGVGTTAKFKKEIDETLLEIENRSFNKEILLISGTSASKFIKKQAEKIEKKVEGVKIDVLAVKNEFFGESVNCTGLLTGGDIINAVKNAPKNYDFIVMPCHVLREKTDLFLDGKTVGDVEKETGKKVRITDGSGESFVGALSLEDYGE